jgi:long-chain acyl-CoA synthetase
MPDIGSPRFVRDYPSTGARRFPRKLALACGPHRLSFADLDASSSRVQNALQRRGIKHADRIGYIGRNSTTVLEVMFGTLKARAVFVPVNIRLAVAEMTAIVNDTGPAFVFVEKEFFEPLRSVLQTLRTAGRLCIVDDEQEGFRAWSSPTAGAIRAEEPRDEDVILELYTSGTTGEPKGVLLMNRNMHIQRESESGVSESLWWRPDDVILAAAPMFNIGGINWALMGLARGATCVILQAFRPPDMLTAIEQFRVTQMFAIPAIIGDLCALQRSLGADIRSLRLIHYGSAPISMERLKEALEIFGCDFAQHYGMTEGCGSKFILPPPCHRGPHPAHLLSCRRAMPGVEARVVDDDGRELDTGMPGELWIKSESLALGFRQRGAYRSLPLRDGWFATGDVGVLDAEGYLTIIDRKKDMIVSGGANVYPAEVERVLAAHPSVRECAVIGVPDSKWGEAVKALIVPQAGMAPDIANILLFLRENLAGYKVPKSIDLVAVLPRSPIGKILKDVLREPYWRGHSRRVN